MWQCCGVTLREESKNTMEWSQLYRRSKRSAKLHCLAADWNIAGCPFGITSRQKPLLFSVTNTFYKDAFSFALPVLFSCNFTLREGNSFCFVIINCSVLAINKSLISNTTLSSKITTMEVRGTRKGSELWSQGLSGTIDLQQMSFWYRAPSLEADFLRKCLPWRNARSSYNNSFLHFAYLRVKKDVWIFFM